MIYSFVHNYCCLQSNVAGILVKQPTCRPSPSSDQASLVGIGLRPATYLDSDSTTLEICCPTEGMDQNMAWLRNETEISDGGRYQFGDGYLKISAPFQDGCVVYTCRVTFEGSVIKEEKSEICVGGVCVNVHTHVLLCVCVTMCACMHTPMF